MSIYIVVDDEEELEDMKVFSNKDEAENYMLDYIFREYDTVVIPSREEVKTYIQENGFFEAVYLIEKEIM